MSEYMHGYPIGQNVKNIAIKHGRTKYARRVIAECPIQIEAMLLTGKDGDFIQCHIQHAPIVRYMLQISGNLHEYERDNS